jgi:hypothetical protein
MRRIQVKALLVTSALLSACTRSSPPPPAQAGHAPETVREPVIALRPLTISQQGRTIARLLSDGRTEGSEPDATGLPAHRVPGPTLRPDGTILLTKGGFAARVQRDGDIYVISPPGVSPREHLFGHISGEQLNFADSAESWAVRVDGRTIVFNGPGFPNIIEGAVDAETRRTALIMTAAFFMDMSITSQ